jgi:site-specific DNA-cytosine methylase
LVIGGPPCVEYSGANANREGVLSAKGSYMLRFGQVLNRIRNFNSENGVSEPFFFCENVPTNWEDQQHIEQEFGISPVVLDSLQMTPAKRNRAYYTNVSLRDSCKFLIKPNLTSQCFLASHKRVTIY